MTTRLMEFPMNCRLSSFVIALAATLPALPAVAAEMPSEAQKAALRSDCREDFLEHCKGVSPGGREALQCLVDHLAEVSGACQSALGPVEQETGIEPPAGSGG
jgi:hypothetical protein